MKINLHLTYLLAKTQIFNRNVEHKVIDKCDTLIDILLNYGVQVILALCDTIPELGGGVTKRCPLGCGF
jgi:hypothetical protein